MTRFGHTKALYQIFSVERLLSEATMGFEPMIRVLQFLTLLASDDKPSIEISRPVIQMFLPRVTLQKPRETQQKRPAIRNKTADRDIDILDYTRAAARGTTLGQIR
jgi:hypothetical protein